MGMDFLWYLYIFRCVNLTLAVLENFNSEFYTVCVSDVMGERDAGVYIKCERSWLSATQVQSQPCRFALLC